MRNLATPYVAKWAAGIIAALFLAVLIFHAGYIAGARHGGPGIVGDRMTRPFGLPHGFVEGGHGVVGTVTSFNPPALVITTRDNATQTALIGTSTLIDPPGATSTTLVPGARVIIIGTPGQGGLQTRIIRVLPQ